ncbi:MAG: hypothetical protein EA396_12325 [Anaerolineaceae bacterium]|nr:MAG: hypothetical protein EA396_12325 [Anaerolineaceae bacterium]
MRLAVTLNNRYNQELCDQNQVHIIMSEQYKPDIWRLQVQWNVRGLVKALKHPSAGIRRRAAQSLQTLGATGAIGALQSALEAERDAAVREHIEAALRDLRQPAPASPSTPSPDAQIEAIIADLRSGDQARIIAAARQAADIRAMPAVETLVVVFNRSQTPLKARLAVAESLLTMASAPVEISLLGALRNPRWQIRYKSAAVLGQLRAEWAVEPLLRCLSDSQRVVRRAAYQALLKINTPQAQRGIETVRQRATRRKRGEAPAPDEPDEIKWPEHEHRTIHTAPTQPLDPATLGKSPHYRQNQEDKSKPQ